MKIIKQLFATLFMATVFIGCNTSSNQATILYQCPMKCEGEKTYDKPGSCPVCKMDLAEVIQKDVSAKNNSSKNQVKIVGAMKNVMRKGDLYATIDIDTIANKQHLFGLGPIEYLTGEIMLMDGKGYKSVVVNDSTMQVTETFAVKAPFFGYATIESWKETEIPDSILTIPQLENFLELTTKNYPRPFLFKLIGTVDNASIHIVNLPKGSKVSSPEEAHQGQKNFNIKNTSAEMLGFFSTEHKTIFTHHDTYVHIHLITGDKQKMGHLEELLLKKGTAKLFLPAN